MVNLELKSRSLWCHGSVILTNLQCLQRCNVQHSQLEMKKLDLRERNRLEMCSQWTPSCPSVTHWRSSHLETGIYWRWKVSHRCNSWRKAIYRLWICNGFEIRPIHVIRSSKKYALVAESEHISIVIWHHLKEASSRDIHNFQREIKWSQVKIL